MRVRPRRTHRSTQVHRDSRPSSIRITITFVLLDFSNLYSCVITRNRNAINVSILDPIFVLNTLGATCIPYSNYTTLETCYMRTLSILNMTQFDAC
ncbi:hypothetical protein Hdeb2414_s0395g00884971 [Helianthus debilis subsp. tardiflorus]